MLRVRGKRKGRVITKRFRYTIIAALLSLVLIVMWIFSSWEHKHRVVNSMGSLLVARESVNWYKEETGTYPDSIRDVSAYARQNEVDFFEPGVRTGKMKLFLPDYHFETISDAKGSNVEHDRLNNLGGFYYDKATGEVRLNLTEPLKEYFPLYFDDGRNAVPATW